ncbi:MAG: hypothetical protein WBG30_11080 [Psychrilyobacter sp.]|uniref:hypothetical protein n=1 Tax=Psychrilyobacter sp. TaxID=2586924 RepID=UPI003C72C2A5
MITIATILLFITILFLYLNNNSKVKYVYINEKTKKYHLEDCPYSKNLKEIPLKNAIKNGYEPCKICNHNNLQ